MEITGTCQQPYWQGINGHGYANVSRRNLYCWRMAGLILYFKIGRAVRFRKSELDAALERTRMTRGAVDLQDPSKEPRELLKLLWHGMAENLPLGGAVPPAGHHTRSSYSAMAGKLREAADGQEGRLHIRWCGVTGTAHLLETQILMVFLRIFACAYLTLGLFKFTNDFQTK